MLDFLRRLWSWTRHYKGRLFLGVLFGILAGLSEPMLMFTVKIAMDTIFPTAGVSPIEEKIEDAPEIFRGMLYRLHDMLPEGEITDSQLAIVLIVLLIPLVMLLRGVFQYLYAYLMNWVSIRTITRLRTDLFQHLLRLPVGFFSRSSTGELMSRLNDINVLLGLIAQSLTIVIKEPVTVVGLLVFLFTLQPKLTLVALIVMPVCLIPITVYARKVRRSSVAIHSYYADLAELAHESFTGNRIIKAYNLEDRVIRQFETYSRKYLGHFMRVIRSKEIPAPMIELFGTVGVAVLLIFLSYQDNNQRTAGDFFSFIGAIFLMYRPVKVLIRLHSNFEQARGASRRVFQLLDIKTNVHDPAHPKPLQAHGAEIRFEHLSFAYDERIILRDIHLCIRPGELVALVGSSGSGKTTLTNLLLRFYDPQKGCVRIGDTDLREVAQKDLRSQMAVVTQETILFNDTIRNNIALGKPGASDQEIIKAAKHAYAHDFIMEKPETYETMIGEKGVSLSGGQRQRIAIARALLKDAPILILDEATSALDTESERAVQSALDELMKGRTTICIAHRLSTIRQADCIVVMEHGRIVETGRHEDLIDKPGTYRRLHELQFQES